MNLPLSGIRSTRSTNPPVTLLYGVDGIGKTSLAAEFPAPIYLATEGERPPSDIDLPAFETPQSFSDILDAIGALMTEPHDYRTLIIDSLDGIEPLVWAATCARIGSVSVDDASKDSPSAFGKGYVQADVEWNELLTAVNALAASGVAVVMLAHPGIVQFNSPTTDPYARYEIKLHKRAAALVREKSDIVGFLNYRATLKSKDVGFNKKVTHAEGGGDRNIFLEERPGFMAKNRYAMPESIQYRKGEGYAALAKYFPEPTGVAQPAQS